VGEPEMQFRVGARRYTPPGKITWRTHKIVLQLFYLLLMQAKRLVDSQKELV
jgi:hypothetical protein